MVQNRKRLLTLAETAEFLAVSVNHLRRLTRDGEIDAINISASEKRAVFRFREASIDEFIERRTHQPLPNVKRHRVSDVGLIDFEAQRKEWMVAKREKAAKKKK